MRYEIHCGRIVRGGADPAEELRRYDGQIVAIQLPCTAPLGTAPESGWTATVDGIIDWAALVSLMQATSATHIVAEKDNSADWRRLARRSIYHMRALGLAALKDAA